MLAEAQPEEFILRGLTEREALERRNLGQGNDIQLETSRSYVDILRQNVFTFINMVLFSIGIILVTLGLYTDALLSVGIVMLNVVIGVIQEARAKRQLDQIALLTRPRAKVIRDGQVRVIDPAEIVLGDALVADTGDQVVVDGEVIGEGRAEVDESLLTGEADPIPKREGDSLYSGSFIVSGRITYEATRVGEASFANQLTTSARTYKVSKTPLQRDIDFIIRILVLLAVQLGVLLGMAAVLGQVGLTEGARVAAVIAGLIPNGLFFMIAIAYAMGAVRMAGRGALIQRSNAVESMSNINVLCLDKTGTLTANRINFHAMQPLDIDENRLRYLISTFAASASSSNRTTDALREAFPGTPQRTADEVPFSSKLKWSAMSFDSGDLYGTYVLGALEMLMPYLRAGTDLGTHASDWANDGLRVLLFAYHPGTTNLHDNNMQPQLPAELNPLGIIALSDELRPEAKATLEGFAQSGIALKIISGDNPHTVAALAKQAGLADDLKAVSGVELAQMTDVQFEQVAAEATVFGRITPQQKERLVEALLRHGHYVAMIGDGVNDVLSLKKANIGIAMQSGSDATRGVADIVLLNDSFAALPPSFQEGQRIINGMEDILRLFLVRVFTMALIIIGVSVLGIGFPFSPINSSLLTLLAVGIPTFALAAWARPGKPEGGILRSVLHFVVPAAFTLSLIGIALYSFFFATAFEEGLGAPVNLTLSDVIALEAETGVPVEQLLSEAQLEALQVAQTALTTLMILCGLALVVFVEPPARFFVGGDDYSGDWRPTILAAGLLLTFIVVLILPPLRDFFDLSPLSALDFALIVTVALVWALTMRYIWRAQWFDRFLNLPIKRSILAKT